MNYSMVRLLIKKDWYLQRRAIAASLAASLAAALAAFGITAAGGKAGSILGVLPLVTVLLTIGVVLVMSTVVMERKEQTLCFVMSLPISSREYTAAKILANLLIFLVPWIAIVLGFLAFIWISPGLPHGLVPLVSIMSIDILVSTCFVLAVALITESHGWTIGAMLVGNLAFSVVGYLVAHTPSIAAGMTSRGVIWSPTAAIWLVVELAAVVLLLSLTFLVQARKTDFI